MEKDHGCISDLKILVVASTVREFCRRKITGHGLYSDKIHKSRTRGRGRRFAGLHGKLNGLLSKQDPQITDLIQHVATISWFEIQNQVWFFLLELHWKWWSTWFAHLNPIGNVIRWSCGAHLNFWFMREGTVTSNLAKEMQNIDKQFGGAFCWAGVLKAHEMNNATPIHVNRSAW